MNENRKDAPKPRGVARRQVVRSGKTVRYPILKSQDNFRRFSAHIICGQGAAHMARTLPPMAATNKCLAQNNKPRHVSRAIKTRRP
jgi:hypothetical protein